MLDPRASVAELAGLPAGDIDAIARVGSSAMAAGRYPLAIKVFNALVAMEPANDAHRLRLALAHHADGDLRAALVQLDDVLGDVAALEPAALVHALLLHAEIVVGIGGPEGKDVARRDLARARALAEASPAARVALEVGT